ncbi:MAG: prepilin-type N-terminal cleavage/methylation domain-containing protein [Planctomycetota bacterium]|nr:prepilin-type N-terminal cleavage/methylation domain-containing protein [Planctomycetota bacterium]
MKKPSRGMSLIEVMIAALILVVAITASLTMFATHMRGARLTEERRLAMQFAAAKIDEIRMHIASGDSLDLVFQRYGPLDYTMLGSVSTGEASGGGDIGTGSVTHGGIETSGTIAIKGAPESNVGVNSSGYLYYTSGPNAGKGDSTTFIVGEDANNNGILDSDEDLNGNGRLDIYLDPIPGRPMGLITIITNEQPNEGDFGRLLGLPANSSASKWYQRNPIGIDITGNRNYMDSTPNPFPMDINGDGDSNDTGYPPDGYVNGDVTKPSVIDKRDDAVIDGFRFLPIVVTIQWTGPYGPERSDLFAVVTKEHP